MQSEIERLMNRQESIDRDLFAAAMRVRREHAPMTTGELVEALLRVAALLAAPTTLEWPKDRRATFVDHMRESFDHDLAGFEDFYRQKAADPLAVLSTGATRQ